MTRSERYDDFLRGRGDPYPPLRGDPRDPYPRDPYLRDPYPPLRGDPRDPRDPRDDPYSPRRDPLDDPYYERYGARDAPNDRVPSPDSGALALEDSRDVPQRTHVYDSDGRRS